jgi:DNA-binding transcriptional MerR regulator
MECRRFEDGGSDRWGSADNRSWAILLDVAASPDQIDIPKRALFKAAEVCELVNVQPYVLRSWEAEFPELGVAKTGGGARVYRRADVEQVARIKHLLLVEGLTLAGARRKLQEDATPVAADVPVLDELIGQNARERLTEVKRGLRSILELLAGNHGAREFRLSPPPIRAAAPVRSSARRSKAARHKAKRARSRIKT